MQARAHVHCTVLQQADMELSRVGIEKKVNVPRVFLNVLTW
jgi:hypothetical protein